MSFLCPGKSRNIFVFKPTFLLLTIKFVSETTPRAPQAPVVSAPDVNKQPALCSEGSAQPWFGELSGSDSTDSQTSTMWFSAG